MTDPFQSALRVAGSALDAQAIRLRVIAENLANANSTAGSSSEGPYVRKTVTFGKELSRLDRSPRVTVQKIGLDPTPLRVIKDPGHPAADENGFVKMPNVDPFVELADLKDANLSYEANLQTIRQARDLFSMTVELLKA